MATDLSRKPKEWWRKRAERFETKLTKFTETAEGLADDVAYLAITDFGAFTAGFIKGAAPEAYALYGKAGEEVDAGAVMAFVGYGALFLSEDPDERMPAALFAKGFGANAVFNLGEMAGKAVTS